jgi:hypothetical protein
MSASAADCDGVTYELRFQSLLNQGHVYSLPCDAAGHVDMNRLSARERDRYLYARAVIGREFSAPRIQRCPSSRSGAAMAAHSMAL